jgi:hypothetical protein
LGSPLNLEKGEESGMKTGLQSSTILLIILLVSGNKSIAAEQWDLSRVPKDNAALQFVPPDAAKVERRFQEIRSQIPRDWNKKFETEYLSEPGVVDGLARLVDFYALCHVYSLEAEKGANTSQFAMERQQSAAAYRKYLDDFDELRGKWKIGNTLSLSSIAKTLERIGDERALPILARGFFFTGNTKPVGDDSCYLPPEHWVDYHFFALIRDKRPDLLATYPKNDHTTRHKNHYDEVRKWILANKTVMLPDGVPKIANVQEGPFLEYIAKKEAAERANPELMETYEPYNGVRTPENRRRILIGVAGLAGLVLLFFTAKMIGKRAKR